ncbi:MAG: nucleotidyl transferase AbiEii/AbiGii toxin family protein [Gammaproteobacteria bacterium]|nr:nucleotidyl transferase AbiEii/AbiGii toxin family protein [Gammaproteobacteria bacterium]MYI22322.1 nucleotidyl transferase AbiEii/AbiGii toxin family protein [Gammaproteobacteria bacterium]
MRGRTEMARAGTPNVAASVHARLKQTRRPGDDFNLTLQRYAAERFLYRLGASDVSDRFVLKGASMFLVWSGDIFRGTQDIDLLGTDPTMAEAVGRDLGLICAVPCPDDGVAFDATRIRLTEMPVEGKRALRCRLVGRLGNMRLPLQVDIGFGDVVTPNPERCEYPTLLDHPKPVLWTYPRETFIAEKFSAMVTLGERNSRIKDVWDIAALAHDFSFDGPTLRLAVHRTVMQRGQISGDEVPGLQAGYYLDAERQGHWERFLDGVVVYGYSPDTLPEAGRAVRSFLGPVWASVVGDVAFEMNWPAGGPWRLHSIGVATGD